MKSIVGQNLGCYNYAEVPTIKTVLTEGEKRRYHYALKLPSGDDRSLKPFAWPP